MLAQLRRIHLPASLTAAASKKSFGMLSIETMAVLGIGALPLFGSEQLPIIMKTAGGVMRGVQNTSQSFIREMERAADDFEAEKPRHVEPTTQADVPPSAPG